MALHWGSFSNTGRLQFQTGTLSHIGPSGKRELWAQTIDRPISRAYGISIGVRCFVGILVLDRGLTSKRRIK